jgi:hypothetical protein
MIIAVRTIRHPGKSCNGTGAKFLAYSLLTHFFGGRRPTPSEASRVLGNLLSRLNRESEHCLTAEPILLALVGEPNARSTSHLTDAGQAEFLRLKELYDAVLPTERAEVEETAHTAPE